MQAKEWAEVIREHREGIEERIQDAYASAATAPRGVEYSVEVYPDGHAVVREYIGNAQSSDVWHGTAMEVYRVKAFDPLAEEDTEHMSQQEIDDAIDWYISQYATEEAEKAIETKLRELEMLARYAE